MSSQAGAEMIEVLYLGHTAQAVHLAELNGPGVGWVPRAVLLFCDNEDLEALAAERRRSGRAVARLHLPAWKRAELGWGGEGAGQGGLL